MSAQREERPWQRGSRYAGWALADAADAEAGGKADGRTLAAAPADQNGVRQSRHAVPSARRVGRFTGFTFVAV
ncbi:hypothetical protein GCM10027080_08980 [Pedococcus soli]